MICDPLISLWLSGIMDIVEPPRWAPMGAFLFSGSWQADVWGLLGIFEENKKNPQKNNCLVPNVWSFPKAVMHRDSAASEFPVCFEKGNIQDQTSPLLVFLFGKNATSCWKPLAEFCSGGVRVFEDGVIRAMTLHWLCSEQHLNYIISNYLLKESDWRAICHPHVRLLF